MDVTHIPCRGYGWGHVAAVIDCHDREIVGYELALRGRAKEAERALEEACVHRSGTLRPQGETPVVRSDNGLIFKSRCFRRARRDYRLRQELITPYTPEQKGYASHCTSSVRWVMNAALGRLSESFRPCILTGGWLPGTS